MSIYIIFLFGFSSACAIDLGQSVILTGGTPFNRKVTELMSDGSSRELPELIIGRKNHGCASYIDTNRNEVLLVTAGVDTLWLSSTEIQVTRSSAWQQVAQYPLSVEGLRGATLNNIIYMTGGGIGSSGDSNDVYKYERGKWTLAGKMNEPRENHAVQVVDKKDVEKFCQLQ